MVNHTGRKVYAELPKDLRPIIDELLDMKQRMPEMGLAHRIKELENFIESELERVKQAADDAEINHSEWEKLNSFFYKNAMKVAADKTKKDPYEALIRKTLTLVEILS